LISAADDKKPLNAKIAKKIREVRKEIQIEANQNLAAVISPSTEQEAAVLKNLSGWRFCVCPSALRPILPPLFILRKIPLVSRWNRVAADAFVRPASAASDPGRMRPGLRDFKRRTTKIPAIFANRVRSG
jgi:hypothetical protein